jgi:DUF971 family protein
VVEPPLRLLPVDAHIVDDRILRIDWSDGAALDYPFDHLRAKCPCAHCAPTMPTSPPLEREAFRGVALTGVEEVGTYALRLRFSDGHNLGLYTYPHLRAIGFPKDKAPLLDDPSPFEV